ncbi:MAG: 16S rRNA (guanine(966)-N(2))-methyltransferase RsmD [Bacteroidota bacterium]
MRIIGGNFRGKKLVAPASLLVRPTTDFAKTGLFNILLNRYDLPEVKVLDLFSGTGSITYELLSRGCTKLHAVDRNRDCVNFIRHTLERLRAPGSVRVYQSDALTFLQKNNDVYDIIFADPPFEEEHAEALLNNIREYKIINPGGLFVLEHVTGKNYSLLPGFEETRKYGSVSFSFFSVD